MGQLVFQANAGGQTALVGPNPSTSISINIPATNGNMVTTGDSGTVTSTMLASSVYTTPGTIGSGTPNTGAFTTLSASSTVSGTGFTNLFAAPPAIGSGTASTGAFTTLSASSTVSGTGFSTYLASPPAIGGTTAAAGRFTTLSATGVTTVQAGTVSAPAITTTGDTNTGIFFPVADTIAFTEGGTEQMRLTSVGNLQINSGYGSVATTFGCRAWVNLNGTGTVSIRGSGNVSSISDNGTGDYTANFTTAMPDANYSAVIATVNDSAGYNQSVLFSTGTYLAGSVRILNSPDYSLNAQDSALMTVAVFR